MKTAKQRAIRWALRRTRFTPASLAQLWDRIGADPQRRTLFKQIVEHEWSTRMARSTQERVAAELAWREKLEKNKALAIAVVALGALARPRAAND